ncbi:MAG: hypothetical protein LBI45_03365 [Bacteroidales bacterium]|jgi:hypothetical protein|nr:hypothetical protein [Bacteroidales bacterium]
MKKITLVLFISLLWIFSFAQPYQSIFGNESSQWIVTNRFVILEESEWMDTISVIDNDSGYRVLGYQCKWNGYNQIIGKIKTNETNSKLYFIEPSSTTELLIMDLDLEIGDAFSMKTFDNKYDTIYVDSIYLFDGKKHIQFKHWIGLSTPPGNSKRVFIEGVGPNWGFESEFNYLIACKYDDYVQTYTFENEYIKNCSFKNVSISSSEWKNDITIYLIYKAVCIFSSFKHQKKLL